MARKSKTTGSPAPQDDLVGVIVTHRCKADGRILVAGAHRVAPGIADLLIAEGLAMADEDSVEEAPPAAPGADDSGNPPAADEAGAQ